MADEVQRIYRSRVARIPESDQPTELYAAFQSRQSWKKKNPKREFQDEQFNIHRVAAMLNRKHFAQDESCDARLKLSQPVSDARIRTLPPERGSATRSGWRGERASALLNPTRGGTRLRDTVPRSVCFRGAVPGCACFRFFAPPGSVDVNNQRLSNWDTWAAAGFAAINAVTFLAFGWDKWRAGRARQRVSELSLVTLAALGGWVGGLIGMNLFRHKTRKVSFKCKYALALIPFVAEIWVWWHWR